jgi:glycosyltransferase involved in cell wall biosynthesis
MLFDWTVARLSVNANYDAIVGYEVASAQMAGAAKRMGIRFVLDAASVHHTFQDAHVGRSTRQVFHSKVCARKDLEIAAADLVLTCSPLAASTYIAAGVDANKIAPMCLGTTVAAPEPATEVPIAGKAKLLFVGRITRVKGFDVLLNALEQLAAGGKAFETTMIANLLDADAELGDQLRATSRRLPIKVLQPMPPSQLAAVYRSNDILLLPSRFDSFGLVVAEALSHGCGVVVSPNVGASMLVQERFNGMTLKNGTPAELAAALAPIIDDITSWRARRDLIRRGAAALDWHHYRTAVAHRIAAHLSTISASDRAH